MSLRPEISVFATAVTLMAPAVAPEAVDARAIDTITTRVGNIGDPNGPRGTFQECAQDSFDGVFRAYLDGGREDEDSGRYDWKFSAEPVDAVDTAAEPTEQRYCAGTRRVTTKISVGKRAIQKIVTIGNAPISQDQSKEFPITYINRSLRVKAATTVSYSENGVTAREKLPTECFEFKINKKGTKESAGACNAGDGPITTDG